MSPWPDTAHLPDPAFVLPREPTPAVITVLGLSGWELQTVARVLQRAGVSAPRHPADVQAHALAFLLPYAIAYGDDWWVQAQSVLAALMPNDKETP